MFNVTSVKSEEPYLIFNNSPLVLIAVVLTGRDARFSVFSLPYVN